jgi:FkbM family methyltransferase
MEPLLPTKEHRGDQSLPTALVRIGAGFVRRRVLRSHGARVQLGQRGVYFDLDLDTSSGLHIYRHGWHDEAADAIERLVARGGVVIDGGANVGGFSLTAASVVGPEGSVHAVEAAPATAALLRRNVLANPHHAIHVHELALADVEGELELTAFEAGSGMSSLAALDGGSVVRVRATTLDALTASLPRVDLVKLDLEGAELRALQGARRLLAERRPALLIELEPDHLGRLGGSVAQLESLLEGAGYAAFDIAVHDGQVRFVAKRSPWRRPAGDPNIVLVPAERSAALAAGAGG